MYNLPTPDPAAWRAFFGTLQRLEVMRRSTPSRST